MRIEVAIQVRMGSAGKTIGGIISGADKSMLYGFRDQR